jgi:hypothetical protein
MTALAAHAGGQPPLTRRQRAGRTVAAALRGGVLGAVVAGIAWLLAGAIAGTAFVVLVVATIAAAALVVLRGNIGMWLWGSLAVGWAVILLERATIGANGGVLVGGAAWLGIILAVRRAGASKWVLPLLAYPLVCAAIAVAAGQSLLDPWGTSWLWVPAVLGPVIGARTLLAPPGDEQRV